MEDRKYTPEKKHRKTCRRCGVEFLTSYKQTLLCSHACRKKHTRKHPGICEYCGKVFLGYHKETRYCSNICSIRDNPKPQNLVKYDFTIELFEEAERETPYGESRLQYVADKLGCTSGAISYAAKRLGYKWQKRPRLKMYNLTTAVERRYVRAHGCICCGEKRVVDSAHIISAREGGSGMEENIMPLCPTHHKLYDKHRLNEDEIRSIQEFIRSKNPALLERVRF